MVVVSCLTPSTAIVTRGLLIPGWAVGHPVRYCWWFMVYHIFVYMTSFCDFNCWVLFSMIFWVTTLVINAHAGTNLNIPWHVFEVKDLL